METGKAKLKITETDLKLIVDLIKRKINESNDSGVVGIVFLSADDDAEKERKLEIDEAYDDGFEEGYEAGYAAGYLKLRKENKN